MCKKIGSWILKISMMATVGVLILLALQQPVLALSTPYEAYGIVVSQRGPVYTEWEGKPIFPPYQLSTEDESSGAGSLSVETGTDSLSPEYTGGVIPYYPETARSWAGMEVDPVNGTMSGLTIAKVANGNTAKSWAYGYFSQLYQVTGANTGITANFIIKGAFDGGANAYGNIEIHLYINHYADDLAAYETQSYLPYANASEPFFSGHEHAARYFAHLSGGDTTVNETLSVSNLTSVNVGDYISLEMTFYILTGVEGATNNVYTAMDFSNTVTSFIQATNQDASLVLFQDSAPIPEPSIIPCIPLLLLSD